VSQRQLISWIDNDGWKGSLSPTITTWIHTADLTSAGTPPIIHKVTNSSGGYYFDYDVTDVYWEASSNDHTMPNALKLKSGRVSSSDNKVTILQPLEGINQITFVTKTSNDIVIPSVSIDILNLSDEFITRVNTNINGIGIQSLNPGTYKVVAHRQKTSFTPFEFSASGAIVVPVLGISFLPSQPSSPNLQTVYGYIIDGSGVAVVGAQIIAEPVTPTTAGSTVAPNPITATTNSVGYFEISLLKAVKFNVHQNLNGAKIYKKQIIITSDTTKDLDTYI